MRRIGSSTFVFLVLTLLLLPSVAFSHSAIVWAYAEGDTIFVEAFFANGTPIQNAEVDILDRKKTIIRKGTTNTEGKYHYKPTQKEPQTVVVIAGESHMGDFELTMEELKELQLDTKEEKTP